MRANRRITFIFMLMGMGLCSAQHQPNDYRSEYYAVLPFWESPYQPVKGACPITEEEALKRIHLKVDYNANNQVIATHVKLGNHYKEFEGRFGNLNINAPLTKMVYHGNEEIHTFFDRFKNQIAVMGNVYRKTYEKDEHGRNIALTFADENGEMAADWFGVVRYTWTHEPDGSIIEERLDEDGKLVPLRSDFQFLRTRMMFNEQGYFGTIQNIDSTGNLVNTDSGAAVFQYFYDQQGRFNRWEVFDKDGQRAVGPSHTSGEQNTWYPYDLKDIIFFNQELNPATHWSGAQRWHFEIDAYGNKTSLEFQNSKGEPMNANGGYAKYVAEWTSDGLHLVSESYFDKDGAKTVHKIAGMHRVVYVRNAVGLITEKRYLGTSDKLINRNDNGIAVEKIQYDEYYRRTGTAFFDEQGKPVQNP
ncbi:hypothetical protein AB1A65_13665 [Muricauda sp. ANG21]|uniref:hypothetical protein n=1 Tax=Allomuricauda sp. ANG21 TaxID=3042468 RepID=UPI0034517D5F